MSTSQHTQILAEHAAFLHRLNVQQVHQMMDAGVLREGEPVELIEGFLLDKDRRDAGGKPRSHGPRHAHVIRSLRKLEKQLESTDFEIQLQLPVTISETSEPEPDAAILRRIANGYIDRHPSQDDVEVVIEVADTSLKYDRTTKLRLYATAVIRAYWIVNLQDNVVEVYSEPDAAEGRYRGTKTFRAGEPITFTLGESAISIDPASLLPTV